MEERTDTEQAQRERKKIVDSNEPDLIKQELLKVGWEQSRLGSGDYMFFSIDFKKVGVERKTISDLLSGLGDRVSVQLANMLSYYDFPILLIEGSWQGIGGMVQTSRGIENWAWNTVWNFLRTWQDKGITLELTGNEGHTIKRLNELYSYYMKEAHTGGLNRKKVGDPRLLAFPPTVGLKTGKVILEELGTLAGVAGAGYQQLIEIDGVGPKRAEAILLFYHKDGRR